MNPFDLLINPILNLLVAFYKGLDFLNVPGSLGLAIILLTTLIRLALWPLTTAQLKSSQKMALLKPHLDRVKAQHGHDKAKHQQEVSKLYKEHGVNPLAGCLPLLLQIPVFIALYQVLLKIVDIKNVENLSALNARLIPSVHLDKLPSGSFIGFNLADKPNQWQQIGVLILLVPILTGVFQFIQSKMMAPASPAKRGEPQTVAPVVKDGKKTGGEMEDAMASMQSQMVFIMPAMIAFFSYGFPFGLSLYWNTFTIIGIIQQYLISGPGSLNKYLPSFLRKS